MQADNIRAYEHLALIVPEIYAAFAHHSSVFSRVGDLFPRVDWPWEVTSTGQQAMGDSYDEFVALYCRTYSFTPSMIKEYTCKSDDRTHRVLRPYSDAEVYQDALNDARYCLSRQQENVVCADRAMYLITRSVDAREALMTSSNVTHRADIQRVQELAQRLQVSAELQRKLGAVTITHSDGRIVIRKSLEDGSYQDEEEAGATILPALRFPVADVAGSYVITTLQGGRILRDTILALLQEIASAAQ